MDLRALRALSAPGLLRSSGRSRVEFKSWLAQGNYRIDDIDDAGGMRLHIANSKLLAESLGYDHSRFACAAFESVRHIIVDAEFPKATAWAAIRMYYAAFFAAHALMRVYGRSCTQVDAAQAALVSKYAPIYGIERNFGKGFFIAEWDFASSTLAVRQLADSHRDTWKEFSLWLQAAERQVTGLTILSADKVEIGGFLSSLRENLSSYGSSAGNWLSTFRNSVNYRHSYDVWYPYKRTSVRFEQISGYLHEWRNEDFNPSIALMEREERVKFFGTCSTMLHFLYQVTRDVINNSERNSIHRTQTSRLLDP